MAHLRLQLLKLSSPLILALVAVGANSALAQSPQASDRGPFTLEGRSWVNQKAFIDSGLRCGVRPLSAGDARAVDEALRVRLQSKPDKPNPGKGGGPPATEEPPPPPSSGGEINVYFHVIHSGSVGLLSAEEIADQMAVLNSAFLGTGFSFKLVSTDYADDAYWFGMTCQGRSKIRPVRRRENRPVLG